MSNTDADDWDTGTEYTLYIGSGPTRAQVASVLEGHFTRDGDITAWWDVEDNFPEVAALGYPLVVDVDGYPGPKTTRAVLAERLGVPIENEITIEDIIDPSIPPPTAEAVAIFGV